MFRFFVNNRQDNHFILSQDVLKHLKVVRSLNQDFICIYEQKFYVCALEGDKALIKSQIEQNHEFQAPIILAAAVINLKRFEWLIQKAAELGVTTFVPFLSQYTSIKDHNLNQKIPRFQAISQNACEQAFRNQMMEIKPIVTFQEILKIKAVHKFIAHEKATGVVPKVFPQDSLFVIGPEGGFSDLEINQAFEQGFEVINLGPRILRAETASLFVLSRISS